MDIKIALERSEYIKQRQYFMKTLVVPKLSNAVTTLGQPLAEVVYEECDEELEGYFGLKPPLKGAGDELWVSPSDLLIGKVVLKPPLTSKHIQALTHKGIIDIGRDIEIKYWNEMEIEKEKALEEQRKYLQEEFENILECEIREVELRECLACKRKLDLLTEEFEAALIEELLKLETRLREEFEEYSRNQEERLRLEWERRLRLEVQRTVQRMTIEFLKELERQEAIMSNNLKLEFQKRDIQRQYDIGLERFKCTENMKQLKHNLECRNIANMMYVLCMERRKCCVEKDDIENYYKGEIKKLNNVIGLKDEQIQKLIDEKNQKIKELKLREACILEILKQFQKFINFALRAAPTQAEFLLSIEKMMVFELADTIIKTKFAHLRPCDKILPWSPPQASPKSVPGLIAPDHHDCFNELDPPRPPGHELGSDDFLPGFSYKAKLYVREDFRNMVSQGIEITRSNELWSEDVELLIETLKKSVSHIDEEDVSMGGESKKHSLQSSIHFESESHGKHDRSKRVSLEVTEEKLSLSLSGKKRVTDRKPSCKPNPEVIQSIDFKKVGQAENEPTLIGATNSLELLKKKGLKPSETAVEEEIVIDGEEEEMGAFVEERGRESHVRESRDDSFRIIKHTDGEEETGSLPGIKEPSEPRSPKLSAGSKRSARDSLVLSTRDSIILRKSSLLKKSTEFNVTPKDSIEVRKDSRCELGRRPSKLVSARNSLEMLRESKLKLKEEIPCPRKDSSKSKSITSRVPSYVPKDICCEKCMREKDQSSEILDVIVRSSKQSKGSLTKSLRVSHVEVINVEDEKREPNVAFSGTPVVYDTESSPEALLDNVSKIYKRPVRRAKKMKDKWLNQRQVVKVLGDRGANEYLQRTNEFTVNRIHSFLSLIKDHPNLIRTFTACTR